MPTKPRPDSPYLASRAQNMTGGRGAGDPTITGQPTPQPSVPNFPAPPTANTAPNGRPPNTRPPEPTPAPPQPIPPTNPITSATGTVPPPPPQAQPVPPPPSEAPAPPSPVQGGFRPFGSTLPLQLMKQPTPAQLLPGQPVQTPHGVATRTANGDQELTLSPEGQQRYKETVVRKRQELGPMPKVLQTIPGLPELPVEPGRWNYSPWTGIMKR